MPGIAPIALPAAYILASMTACPQMPPATVDIRLTSSEPALITNMTTAEMTRGFANNPDSTLSTEPGWVVGGLTLAPIEGQYSVQMNQERFSDATTCLGVEEVDVDLVYTPEIYIASDYLNRKCQYTVTLAHEQRHVGTDLKTINDFSPEIKRRIQEYVDGLGVVGPMNADEAQQAADTIVQQVRDAASPIVDDLIAERRKRQAVFDTQANYEKEDALCPRGENGEDPGYNGDDSNGDNQ